VAEELDLLERCAGREGGCEDASHTDRAEFRAFENGLVSDVGIASGNCAGDDDFRDGDGALMEDENGSAVSSVVGVAATGMSGPGILLGPQFVPAVTVKAKTPPLTVRLPMVASGCSSLPAGRRCWSRRRGRNRRPHPSSSGRACSAGPRRGR